MEDRSNTPDSRKSANSSSPNVRERSKSFSAKSDTISKNIKEPQVRIIIASNNKAIGTREAKIKPLDINLNKRIFLMEARSRGINISLVNDIIGTKDNSIIDTAYSLLQQFNNSFFDKIIAAYIDSNFNNKIKNYTNKVLLKIPKDKVNDAIEKYSTFLSNNISEEQFLSFITSVNTAKFDSLFSLWANNRYSDEVKSFIIEVENNNFSEEKESFTLSMANNESIVNIKDKSALFKIISDHEIAVAENLITIFKGFKFEVTLVDQAYQIVEQIVTIRKSEDKKNAVADENKINSYSLKDENIKSTLTSSSELTKIFSFFDKVLKSPSSDTSDSKFNSIKPLLRELKEKRITFDEIKKNVTTPEKSRDLRGTNIAESNPDRYTKKSLHFKLKFIDSYNSSAKDIALSEARAEIDASASYEIPAFKTIIEYLDKVSYREDSLNVLLKTDFDQVFAHEIVSKFDATQTASLLLFNHEEIKELLKINNLNAALKLISNNTLQVNHIRKYIKSNVSLDILSRLLSLNAPINSIIELGNDYQLFEDYLNKPEYRDSIFELLLSNASIDKLKLARQNAAWATFNLACKIVLKSDNNSYEEAMNFIEEIVKKKTLYTKQTIKDHVISIDDNSTLVNFKNSIFDSIESDITSEISTQSGTHRDDDGNLIKITNRDGKLVKEYVDRPMYSGDDSNFGTHLKRINFLVDNNRLVVGRVTGICAEGDNLQVKDLRIDKPITVTDPVTGDATTVYSDYFNFTMHMHPLAAVAAVGSTESSKKHFKPSDFAAPRVKIKTGVDTLWSHSKKV